MMDGGADAREAGTLSSEFPALFRMLFIRLTTKHFFSFPKTTGYFNCSFHHSVTCHQGLELIGHQRCSNDWWPIFENISQSHLSKMNCCGTDIDTNLFDIDINTKSIGALN